MYFSVRTPLKIAGKVYRPCICYELPEELELTVAKLVGEGKAYTYKHLVHFQNGKILPRDEEKETVKKSVKRRAPKADEGGVQ